MVDSIMQLRDTLIAWDKPQYEPVAIEVKAVKRDILRRVAAEGLSRGDYIIADLGSEPTDVEGIYHYKKGEGGIRVEECPERIQ